MKLSKKGMSVLGITLVVLVVLLLVYGLPIVTKVRADLKARETQVAYRNDYKLHTTPLSADVIDDICSKLNIQESSESCQPDAGVYAPDLFDEIKTYFNNLPDHDKTYDIVQEKLGVYLDYCGKPYPNGDYRCRYDIRGDYVYPIFFHFDKNGMYYRIIANIGGS
jgi:hypothetical protein